MARKRVWFYRIRAALWLIGGVLAFPLGWSQSVALVWAASVYANIGTDLSAAEAADDGPTLRAVGELRDEVKSLRIAVESLARQVRCDGEHDA